MGMLFAASMILLTGDIASGRDGRHCIVGPGLVTSNGCDAPVLPTDPLNGKQRRSQSRKMR